jgi:hypothetical protein
MQLFFTHLLRKTSAIGSIKVKGDGSDGRGRRSGPFVRLASGLFFSSELFFPELETDEEKILKRNPARKKGRARVDHLSPTSNRSMDELF